MRRNQSKEKPRRLTEVELELMSILWELGAAGVSDVIAKLPPGRELAYTSVSTMLRILEGKGIVAARKQGRGHVYEPILTRAEYEAHTVKDVVERVFAGVPVAMVRQLLDNVDLSEDDIREVRKLLSRAGARR